MLQSTSKVIPIKILVTTVRIFQISTLFNTLYTCQEASLVVLCSACLNSYKKCYFYTSKPKLQYPLEYSFRENDVRAGERTQDRLALTERGVEILPKLRVTSILVRLRVLGEHNGPICGAKSNRQPLSKL